MAFKKYGDAQPIIDMYDADGEQQVCDSCGEKLIVVEVNADDNKLVCPQCDSENGE